ncbi:MAG: ankyrin repeat domain-containing protein [Bacteroidales bacterium]
MFARKVSICLFVWLALFYGSGYAFQRGDTLAYEPDDDEYNLIIASLKGDLPMIQQLLDKGINPNTVIDESITPLIYAVQGGQPNICNYLIARGADVNFRPSFGPTPLIVAIKAQRPILAEMLVNMGASVNAGDEQGRTPIMYAIAQNDTVVFQKLLSWGANLTQADTSGITPLMVAVMHNRPYFVHYILNRGISPDMPDIHGVTPFLVAVANANYPMMDLLLEYGANINHISRKKHSALTIALEKQDEKLIQYLVDKGADVNLKIRKTETPLTIANYFNSDIFLREILTSNGARQSIWPDFRQMSIGPEFLGNFQHIMMGANVGLRDFRYDVELSAGFLARLTPTRILVPTGQSGHYYQFWESRYLWYAGLDKKFLLRYKQNSTLQGIFIGARWVSSHHSYRGSSFPTSTENTWAIHGGYYYIFRNVKLYFSYQYLDFGFRGVSPHHYNFGVNLYLGKSIHFDNKRYQPWQ